MCDCFGLKCHICGREIPFHIGDFAYPGGCVESICTMCGSGSTGEEEGKMERRKDEKRYLTRDMPKTTYDRRTGLLVREGSERPASPELIDIAVTKQCYGGCTFCYQNADPDGRHADIEYILRCIDSMERKPFQVALGGGEPTLWPGLSRFLTEMDRRKINVALTVGPKANLHELAFHSQCGSLSAVGISFHDKDSFIRTAENVWCKRFVHLVLFPERMPEYIELFDSRWWPFNLVDGVVCLLLKEVGRCRGVRKPTEEELKNLHTAMLAWADWSGGKSIGYDPCTYRFTKLVAPTCVQTPCDGGKYSMYWDAVERIVLPCSFLKDRKAVLWNGESFSEIWGSKDMGVSDCRHAW